MAVIIIKETGIHEGLFDISFKLNVAIGMIGPSLDAALPGAMFGIAGVVLNKVDIKGVNTIDAAEVNPINKNLPRK